MIDARSGRVYVNREVFTATEPAESLLRDLRRGGGPQPDYSQAPPKSLLLTNTAATIPLAWGDYCWSSPSGEQWVTACADHVAPSQRFDLPLVVADPAATIQARLGFAPSSVQVAVLDRVGAVIYSQALLTSQVIRWTVPENLPVRSFLEITAGRPGFPQDSAAYLARLDMASCHSGTLAQPSGQTPDRRTRAAVSRRPRSCAEKKTTNVTTPTTIP